MTYWTKDDEELPEFSDDEDDYYNEEKYRQAEEKRIEKEEKRKEKDGKNQRTKGYIPGHPRSRSPIFLSLRSPK